MTRKIMMLALGGVLVLGAVACDDGASDTSAVDDATETTEPSPGGMLDGEQVTVSGTVEEVLAGRAFTLTDATVEEGTATTDGDLAVLVSDEDAGVSQADQVLVTGTLHEVDVSEQLEDLEDLFGIRLDEDVVAQFEGRQLIIASEVETTG